MNRTKVENVVLRGADVYAQIVMIDNAPLLDKNSIQYKRYSYQAIAFIMREPAYSCFDRGDMAQLTLTPTERTVDEINTETGEKTGNTLLREGWTYGGHLTTDQDFRLTVAAARKEALYRQPFERIHTEPDLSIAATYGAGNPAIIAAGYPTVRPQDFPDITNQHKNNPGQK